MRDLFLYLAFRLRKQPKPQTLIHLLGAVDDLRQVLVMPVAVICDEI